MSTEARALHHLQKSIEINPHFVDARVFLAEYYHRNKEPDKALGIVNESLSNRLKKTFKLKSLNSARRVPQGKRCRGNCKGCFKICTKRC